MINMRDYEGNDIKYFNTLNKKGNKYFPEKKPYRCYTNPEIRGQEKSMIDGIREAVDRDAQKPKQF